MQPAVGVDRFGRFLGHVVVADHHAVPAAAEFALLAVAQVLAGFHVDDLRFEARQRPADGADAQLDRIVGARLRDQRRRFRLAVADRDFAGAHFLRDALHHLDRARAAGHDAGPQRRQISPRIVFVLELAMNIVGTP